MSSNMSNLRRGRKAPFPIPSNQPERAVPFRNPEYSDDESRLLEEITGNVTAMRMRERQKSPPDLSSCSPKLSYTETMSRMSNLDPVAGGLPKLMKASPAPRILNANTTARGSNNSPSDHELMACMMSRLSSLELKLQFQTKEIIEKDRKTKILEEKVKLLQKARDGDNPNRVNELEKKCLLLQQQINEMEQFLNDYGMIWAGESQDPDCDVYNEELSEDSESGRLSTLPPGTWNPESSVTGKSTLKVDFDLVLENIQELNALAGEGIGKIQHTTDGARLKMPDPIQLTLYANGILMFSGPFRPYSDPVTQACMQDFMDGYFPSELQNRYPDGVPFKVTDKRTVHFKDRMSEIFQGAGQVLGGESKPSRLVPTNIDKASNADFDAERYEDANDIPGNKLTMEQFLKRIPQSVIKGGRVVSVREGVTNTLQGSSGKPVNVTVLETPVVQELRERLEVSDGQRPASSRDVTTLRIKSENGDQTYILKMKFTDTIGDVRRYLDEQRPKSAPSYEIAATFPSTVFNNSSSTLLDCGLTPNAALHLRIKK